MWAGITVRIIWWVECCALRARVAGSWGMYSSRLEVVVYEVWAWVSPNGWRRVAVVSGEVDAQRVGGAWWERTGHRPIVHVVD